MPDGCTIGIDPGERWIGVARASATSSLALPVGTLDLRCGNDIATDLRALIGGEMVATLVVGVPVRPDGREDAQATSFREFGEWLAASIGAECAVQDERFSSDPIENSQTQNANGRKARSAGRKSVRRQRRERERSHAEAAARILQRWLDARAGSLARAATDARESGR